MKKYLTADLSLRKILTALYFGGCFIFFAFFYKYHLYYIEQMQLFRLSRDYIAGYFHKPASISCLAGDFLTQFYYLKAGGAVIITCSLLLLWYLIDWAVSSLFSWKHSYLLSLLATALVTCFHFDIAYPLAATVSLIIALAVFRMYTLFPGLTNRIISGIILVPLLYLAAGLAVYLFLLVVILYEFKIKQVKGLLKLGYSFLLILIVLIFPVSMRTHYSLTVRQARLYPVTEPVKPIPYFVLESVFSFDCEWYFNHPEKTIKLAMKDPVRSRYAIYYYNLASAAVNKLPENLLSFDQMGLYGMFIPFDDQTNSTGMLFGNEVYYFIGDVNASQHYALMANTFSPKGESSRMIRRLAETNIINGEYAAAEKYLKMLGQTLFYRQWAHKAEQYLYNDELCSKTPWIAGKRAKMPVTDHINPNFNYSVNSLYDLLDDHPDNQAALDYLLTMYLLYKDINGFYKVLTTYKSNCTDVYLPRLYQEALIVYFELHKEDKNFNNFRFSYEVIQQLMLFKEKFRQSRGNSEALIKDFGRTYWFYLNFAVLPQ